MTQRLTTEKEALVLDAPGMPKITAAGVTLHIQCYIAGRTNSFVPYGKAAPSPGCGQGVSDLWFLSMIADISEATKLEATWSVLAERSQSVAVLEDPNKPNGGTATVSLGRHRTDLKTLGWSPHYRWFTTPVTGTETLHGVLEPAELTCWRVESRGKSARRQNLADPEALKKQIEEEAARQQQPIFLLMARPQEQPELHEASRSLAHLHMRFLANRVDWLAYYEPHQQYLWQRAWAEGEVEELYTYCFTPEGQQPWLRAAFLCRPNLLKLDAALRSAIARGVFGRPVVEGSVSRDKTGE